MLWYIKNGTENGITACGNTGGGGGSGLPATGSAKKKKINTWYCDHGEIIRRYGVNWDYMAYAVRSTNRGRGGGVSRSIRATLTRAHIHASRPSSETTAREVKAGGHVCLPPRRGAWGNKRRGQTFFFA